MPKKPVVRRTWPEDFKRAIVVRMEKGESPSAIADEIGVHVESLYPWKKKYGTGVSKKRRSKHPRRGEEPVVTQSGGDPSLESLFAELRAELESLRAFKKAVLELASLAP